MQNENSNQENPNPTPNPAPESSTPVDPTTSPESAAGSTPTEPSQPRSVVDRRAGLDRRQKSRDEANYTGPERRVGSRRTGLERRRGAGIRREEERRSAEEGEMTAGQFEFVMAIETYKKVNKKLFPTWTEVLEVMEQLGYRKVQKRKMKLDDVPESPLFDGKEERKDDDEGEGSRVAA